jgi:hypothetical protein
MIEGENLWGHHLIDVNGALGLEPVDGWRNYLLTEGRRSSALTTPPHVKGIEQYVVIWPEARSGKYTLRLDGESIPFELVIQGAPARAANPSTTAAGASGQPASFFEKILPFVVMGLVLGALYALGPLGWAIGAGLGAYGLWQSYQEGGWQRVWDDLTPHEFLDLIVNFEKLSGWQRLEKLFTGGMKVLGLVGGMFGGKYLVNKALHHGKRAIQQGRQALHAWKRPVQVPSTPVSRGRSPVDAAKPPRLGNPIDMSDAAQRTPLSDKLWMDKKVGELFKGEKPLDAKMPAKEKFKTFLRRREQVYDLYKQPHGKDANVLEPGNRRMSDTVEGYKDGLKRLQAKFGPNKTPEPGEVLRPPEAHGFRQQESFEHFKRERRHDHSDTQKRVYANIRANDGPAITEKLVREVVDNRRDFPDINGTKIALPNDAGIIHRTDTHLVYTKTAQAQQGVVDRLKAIGSEAPESFIDHHPPMTKRQAPGIATADEPRLEGVRRLHQDIAQLTKTPLETVEKYAGGRSAGSLKSNAMVVGDELHRQGIFKTRHEAIDFCFKRYGIDPLHPDRNHDFPLPTDPLPL